MHPPAGGFWPPTPQHQHDRIVTGNGSQNFTEFIVVDVISHAAGITGTGADNGDVTGKLQRAARRRSFCRGCRRINQTPKNAPGLSFFDWSGAFFHNGIPSQALCT
jgi:hypothetical protein